MFKDKNFFFFRLETSALRFLTPVEFCLSFLCARFLTVSYSYCYETVKTQKNLLNFHILE